MINYETVSMINLWKVNEVSIEESQLRVSAKALSDIDEKFESNSFVDIDASDLTMKFNN